MSDESKKIKENDRVRRLNTPGCLGTVKEVKTEISATTPEAREKHVLINVQWDNGTLSYLSPAALEIVS